LKKDEVLFSVVYDFTNEEMFCEVFDKKVSADEYKDPLPEEPKKGDIVEMRERRINHGMDTFLFEIRKKVAEGSTSLVYLMEPICKEQLGATKAFNINALDKGRLMYEPLWYGPQHNSLARSYGGDREFVLKLYRIASSEFFTTIEGMDNLVNSALDEFDDDGQTPQTANRPSDEMETLIRLNDAFPGLFPEMIGEAMMQYTLLNKNDTFRRYFVLPGAVLEYCGPTLDERLKKGDLSDGEKALVSDDVFRSVYALQRLGRIHKDLSLGNVCIRNNGGGRAAKILDLSFAQYIEGKEELKSHLVEALSNTYLYAFNIVEAFPGNRLWSPPEVHDGYLSSQFDVWSAGLLSFAAFTGEHLIPVFDNGEIISFRGDVSKETKRRYFTSLGNLLKIGTGKTGLQRVIDERIKYSGMPEKYKKAITMCCVQDPEQRPDMEKVLEETGITLPKHNQEYFDREIERIQRSMSQE